ncbi:protein brain tumor [Parasteatoda tepidariorum]|uniref:protein brain tumor n=1 Tax=Parasteatoda tepidariorum TaxID=114398 RepID=UPI001C7183AA|nr:brain tumor protein [Parasteatoda tepidariorum]
MKMSLKLNMISPPSSLPDTSLFGSPVLDSLDDQMPYEPPSTKCSICRETFKDPKVLICLHTFCQQCLERVQDSPENITCPKCKRDCALPIQGVAGLHTDYAVSNLVGGSSTNSNSPLPCTGCKNKESNAVARCVDCNNFLCSNCVTAHRYMHCFEGHEVRFLNPHGCDDMISEKMVCCPRHENEMLRFFCKTCNELICQECALIDHLKGSHDFDNISDIGPKQIQLISELTEKCREKAQEYRYIGKMVNTFESRLDMQLQKAKGEVTEAYNFYCNMLTERKTEILKQLEDIYNTKKVGLHLLSNSTQEIVENIDKVISFVDRITKYSSMTEILTFKGLIDSKLQYTVGLMPDPVHEVNLEFISNFQAIEAAVRNTFGYIKHDSIDSSPRNHLPQPIARPNSTVNSVNIDCSYQNGHIFDPIPAKKFGSTTSLGPFTHSLSDITPYEKWSSGSTDILQNGTHDFSLTVNGPTMDLANKYISPGMYPVKSQIKRQKMIYHCKFGEFGVMEGQFTEPSGVAVNAQNDIIVADTNNHRIQIFDKEGRFKFQFGECGKRDGQLLYPNRVAVVKNSGDIIVTERSPTHQIQIYNQYGQFVRKFGANILQHPRGVTVDAKGLIIVAECKVMRVIIFDQEGNVMHKFGCSKHLEFPNGVVVNDKQEIFISDNRAHCVKVFDYEGHFLRQIGGEGLTNYPIGVCINTHGEILVADNHNNFNITVFTQDGQLVSASESKVKHAQCFDVALMDDGSVILASKDYRLYIYRYMQIPSIGI